MYIRTERKLYEWHGYKQVIYVYGMPQSDGKFEVRIGAKDDYEANTIADLINEGANIEKFADNLISFREIKKNEKIRDIVPMVLLKDANNKDNPRSSGLYMYGKNDYNIVKVTTFNCKLYSAKGSPVKKRDTYCTALSELNTALHRYVNYNRNLLIVNNIKNDWETIGYIVPTKITINDLERTITKYSM